MPSVSALHIYPIKSCRGLELKAVRLDPLGALYDRRFMLVSEEDGKFLSQRELPRMALIEPKLGPTALGIGAPHMPPLKVAMTQRDAKRVRIKLWQQDGEAEDAGETAAAWFSQFLERACRLVRLPEGAAHRVDERYARSPAYYAFADGFPILLTTEASLADLNARLSSKVPMNRFRPNVVVRDTEAFAEDTWKRIRIGEVVLDVVKPCARCVIPGVDQITAQTAKEPMATLASYRSRDNKVYFGQNCIHLEPGSIRVGDDVEVLETA
jgi:uncharacterized protein YcbX